VHQTPELVFGWDSALDITGEVYNTPQTKAGKESTPLLIASHKSKPLTS